MRLTARSLKRLGSMLLVIFVVSLGVFSLTALLPGDPVTAILGDAAGDPAARAQVRQELGLDAPFPVRYGRWLESTVKGDLGKSYIDHQTVGSKILQALPPTLELVLLSECMAIVLALVLALVSAATEGGILDRILTLMTFQFLAIPSFVMAIVVIFVFAVSLHWLPATGYTPLAENIQLNLRSMTLPTLVLGLHLTAVYTRILRNDMMATLREDFIRMAQAKGEPVARILLVHALKPSSLSLLTAIGINVGALIGGSVIVESLFGIQGVGRLLVAAIFSRDYLVVQGVLLVVSAAYVLINGLIDLGYGVLDPRIRASS